MPTIIASALTFARKVPRWGWAALGLILALLAVWAWHNRQVSEAASEGREKGAQQQREADLTETIERVETANETRQAIESEVRNGSGDALYRQCLRTARTPANCERLLPERETLVR